MANLISSTKGNVVLIFDEIENISPETAASPHWKYERDTLYFWQIIRSYTQTDSKGRFSICLVGTSPHILETASLDGVANPIYLYAQKRFIPNLNISETKEMVQRLGYFMGLEFSDAIVFELQKDFGGHPFFTRQVCSKIHQMASTDRPIKVSQHALRKAITEFSGQLELYLKEIIGNLQNSYPQEYAILLSIIRGDKTDINEFGNEAPDLIDHLIGYGMVERVGDDFDIRINAIKSVLSKIIADEGREDRWSEVCSRRNTVEIEIRTALYHQARMMDSAHWLELLKSNLTLRRFESLDSIEPKVLLSSKDSPLYLTDLIMILKDHSVLPYLNDKRSDILSNLDAINKLRKDAHANTFSDAEIGAARKALDSLEIEFSAL